MITHVGWRDLLWPRAMKEGVKVGEEAMSVSWTVHFWRRDVFTSSVWHWLYTFWSQEIVWLGLWVLAVIHVSPSFFYSSSAYFTLFPVSLSSFSPSPLLSTCIFTLSPPPSPSSHQPYEIRLFSFLTPYLPEWVLLNLHTTRVIIYSTLYF
jgi:hypothetical protein